MLMIIQDPTKSERIARNKAIPEMPQLAAGVFAVSVKSNQLERSKYTAKTEQSSIR